MSTIDITAENNISTTAFNLTDRLPIFSYLVSSNRVNWYRHIMRTFWHSHRNLYRYQLTAHEVRDAVREQLDPTYTLEQCQNDLTALKEWGNVTTIYDSSRATSIASFLSPALLYQATPEAMSIETFLAEQARANAASGSLRQGDLDRLWQALQRVDETLQLPAASLTTTQTRELAEEWQRAFEIWNTMAREAAQYLANMISASQLSKPEIEAYQQYKAAVVAYVHGFAQALTHYGPRIREQIRVWHVSGQQERLISIIAAHLDPPALNMEQMRPLEEIEQDARHQMDALVLWFAPGKNADSFRRNALAEVDKVVRRAAALAAAARPNANYANQLNTLAHQLLRARDGETAQQLFALAFANQLPMHLPEGLAGTPSDSYQQDQTSAWLDDPRKILYLRPVNRAGRNELPHEDPIIDNRTIIRHLIVQYEQKIQEQREYFARLFSSTQLDIGAQPILEPAMRDLLLEVIDSCLSHHEQQFRAPDNSVVVLLNPRETTYTLLQATDGLVFLPRYLLERRAGTTRPDSYVPEQDGQIE
ncbi:DUF2397 family protein [Dictyobacter arantiisoli]|uniref:TIGR02677 family protein n=1 Tax=Dictyobacter arantiisoli TaxID=2014874 RepID=A0A5A5TE24_9CHLR|nr:DUF2397 family protein [Dictyobacter arantiisoli]GCF09567.1 TIGR02677 family protein [Dictyobacter arantiisoli]